MSGTVTPVVPGSGEETTPETRHPQPVTPAVPQTIVASLKSKYSVPNGAQTIATAIKQIPDAEEEEENLDLGSDLHT